MPLLFEAEPLEALRARYRDAIRVTVDTERVAAGHPEERPALKRAHVFDFEDGMRLIISKERMPDSTVGIHMSASISDYGEAYDRLKSEREPIAAMLAMAVAKWCELSGRDVAPEFLGLSAGMVPHWFEETVL